MEYQPHMVDEDSVALVLGGLQFKIWEKNCLDGKVLRWFYV